MEWRSSCRGDERTDLALAEDLDLTRRWTWRLHLLSWISDLAAGLAGGADALYLALSNYQAVFRVSGTQLTMPPQQFAIDEDGLTIHAAARA